MPKIISAAVKFFPKDSKYAQIICGKRHSDCFDWMFHHQIEYEKSIHIQGFLTDTDQFVDRYEAMELAYDAGQISLDTYNSGSPLFSEDLW